MFYIYILQSLDKKHWYVGSTENLKLRLEHHNNGYTFSTKPYKPWEMVYSEEFQTRKEAVNREMFLKSPMGYQEYLSIKKKVLEESDSGSFHRPGKSAL